MQVLTVIIPFMRGTNNLALSCKAHRDWLFNNGFTVRTSMGELSLENYSFYKSLGCPCPYLDEWMRKQINKSIKTDNHDHLQLLLAHKPDLEVKDWIGDTPLIRTVRYGKPNYLRLLLQNGAKIEAKNNHRNTALIVATRLYKPACIEVLLEYGAKVYPYMREKYPEYTHLWRKSTL